MKSLAVELTTIVQDDHPRYPESAYDVLPYKVLDLRFCDCGKGLCFHPFHEVINCDE